MGSVPGCGVAATGGGGGAAGAVVVRGAGAAGRGAGRRTIGLGVETTIGCSILISVCPSCARAASPKPPNDTSAELPSRRTRLMLMERMLIELMLIDMESPKPDDFGMTGLRIRRGLALTLRRRRPMRRRSGAGNPGNA